MIPSRRFSLRPVWAAFPKDVRDRLTDEPKREFMEGVNLALSQYYAAMPIGQHPRRSHRSAAEIAKQVRAQAKEQIGRLAPAATARQRARYIRQRAAAARIEKITHRPTNAVRLGLLADIFIEFMTLCDAVRGEDAVTDTRGFKHVADAVLRALGLSFRVTDHDMVALRKQRRPFAVIEASLSKHNR